VTNALAGRISGTLLLRGFSWPKILLKFDVISATRPVTVLDIVVTRRIPV